MIPALGEYRNHVHIFLAQHFIVRLIIWHAILLAGLLRLFNNLVTHRDQLGIFNVIFQSIRMLIYYPAQPTKANLSFIISSFLFISQMLSGASSMNHEVDQFVWTKAHAL